MKKLIGILLAAVFTVISLGNFSNAVNIAPQYDATYNNNKGILYANGNEIVIKSDASNITKAYWDGGSQELPQTVTVVGGGSEGTTFDSSDITMESGTVSLIYGGGKSLTESSIATVKDSNVTINGGTILATVYGGGLMYTNTEDAEVTINNGRVAAICGGGCASAVINGVAYSAGTEAEPQNSKNRTINAEVEINGGIIDKTPTDYGLVFGGGQGYSYVENAKVNIKNGDLSKAYVTAGGSNGYTKNADLKISGGIISCVQSVNRGKMENAKIKIDGGRINDAYIGGENDPSVTGIISKVDFSIINGNITNLKPGTSNGSPIVVEQVNYKVVSTEGKVQNSQIGEKEIKITYTFEIDEDEINIPQGQNKKINIKIVTTPTGYENLFEEEKISWNIDDEEIATVDENGNISAKKVGNTVLTAGIMNDKFDSVNVNVGISPIMLVGLIVIIFIYILIINYIIRG